MKALVLSMVLSSSSITYAATWQVEIRNGQTSEVKIYKFLTVDTHKLEMPNFQHQGCMLKINEPTKVESGDRAVTLQKAEVACIFPTGGIFVKKLCNNIPSEIDKATFAALDVIEDGAKFVDKKNKKKAGKFSSYGVMVTCE